MTRARSHGGCGPRAPPCSPCCCSPCGRSRWDAGAAAATRPDTDARHHRRPARRPRTGRIGDLDQSIRRRRHPGRTRRRRRTPFTHRGRAMMLLAGPTTAHDLLFDGAAADPAAGLALDFGGQLNGNLPTTIGGEARKAVARDLADAAVELTHLDLTDVLASGWQRHTELRAAGRRTRDLPGTRETVVLAQHRISHEAHPYVDVLLGDARLTRVSLTVLVTVDVTALAATVTARPADRPELGTGARHGNPGPRRRAHRPTQQGVQPAAGARLRGGSAAGVTPDATAGCRVGE